MADTAVTMDDVILDVLLSVHHEQRSIVSDALIKEIYDLQRQHQFEDDRVLVLTGIRKAVASEVDRISEGGVDQ